MSDETLRERLEHRLIAAIDDARTQLETVAAMSTADRRRFYVRLLSTTFHYTRRSGEFFGACRRSAPTQRLEAFYDHLRKEEATHYLLARRDLEAMDEVLDPVPPLGVVAYWQCSFEVIERLGSVGGLGVSLLTEHILPGLGPELLGRLFGDLELTPEQFSFMRVHLLADEDHGREVDALVDEHIEEHGERILQGLSEVSGPYVGMLDECIPRPMPIRVGA